jgi:hypothetical protein
VKYPVRHTGCADNLAIQSHLEADHCILPLGRALAFYPGAKRTGKHGCSLETLSNRLCGPLSRCL